VPGKKKTRRGSRGGRNRKKKPAGATAEGAVTGEDAVEAVAEVAEDEAVETAAALTTTPTPGSPRIHVPDFELGGEEKPARRRPAQKPKPEPTATEDGNEPVEAVADAVDTGSTQDGDAAPVKKKTRRGSRGGRNRKKPAAAGVGAAVVASENGAEAPAEPVVTEEPEASGNGAEPATDEYVPMSEWLDDLDA
jgi:hypothetical protein